MIPQSFYVFPDTLPKDETLFPLVQLFAQAVYIAPVENDPPDALPPLAEELLVQGVLRFHCPVPLGADRERFLCLIKELRQRPGEYAALALTACGGEAEKQDAIIRAVRRQTAGRAEADALWQARVVLKLAEFAEQQEEEIRQSLRRLALCEQELFSRLRDPEGPFCGHADAASSSPSDSRRLRLRLKAWRQLAQPLSDAVFITADRDAFDSVMEDNGTVAQVILELPLPAVPAACDFAAKRQRFRQDAAALISGLLQHPADFPAEEWHRLLEEQYPAAEHGRCLLTLQQRQDSDSIFGILERKP